MPDPISGLTYGDALTAEQVEALRDGVQPDQAAGDADWWGGAAYVYVVPVDVTVGGQGISAGVYLRQVCAGTAGAWPVLSGDTAAFIDEIEAQYLRDTP